MFSLELVVLVAWSPGDFLPTPFPPWGLLSLKKAEDVLPRGSDTLHYPRHSRRYRLELGSTLGITPITNLGLHPCSRKGGDPAETTASMSLEDGSVSKVLATPTMMT